MSVLERDSWLDKSIDFIISDIIEYDMRRAGLSISKELHLLSMDSIAKLESMEKSKSDKQLGIIQRENPEFKSALKEGFKQFRLKFGEINELQDSDILSVKKDAIYTKKYCQFTSIGEHILFREKNHYEAYMHLNNLELYWNSDGTLDVKGIAESNVEYHKDYMISFLWKFIAYLSCYDIDSARKYLVKFIDDYKFKRLSIGYYREFNSQSVYSYIMYDSPTTADYLDEKYLPLIIPHYNYLNVLVPLLKFVM